MWSVLSPLFVHPSTCYHTLAIFCISPAWCKPSPPLFSSALMLIPLLPFFSICPPRTFQPLKLLITNSLANQITCSPALLYPVVKSLNHNDHIRAILPSRSHQRIALWAGGGAPWRLGTSTRRPVLKQSTVSPLRGTV